MGNKSPLDEKIIIRRNQLSDLVCSKYNFFLSWRLFEDHMHGCNTCNYLSLGEKMSDWVDVVVGEESVYERLLTHAADSLELARGTRPTLEITEILLGNLLLTLSSLVQRTRAQLGRVSSNGEVEKNLGEFHLDIPLSTQDSYNLISSSQYQELCQSLLKACNDGTRSTLTLNCAPKNTSKRREKWQGILYNLFSMAIAPLSRNSKSLIIATYLGRYREMLLNLKLGQIPLLSEFKVSDNLVSPTGANVTDVELGTPSLNEVLKLLVGLVVPLNLSKGVDESVTNLIRRGWPKSPKVIFTSNAFDSDDDFKLYLERFREESRYIVGQHGNNYSVATWTERLPEVVSADRFLAWGVSGYEKSLSVGVLKPRMSTQGGSPRKGILLVLRDSMSNFHYVDEALNNALYEAAIIETIGALLDQGVKTRVRPHSSSSTHFLAKLEDLFGRSELFDLSTSRIRFEKEVRNYLPAFTYDSTGMLELASVRVEFLGYFPDGLAINEEMRDVYQHLSEVGLISLELQDFLSTVKTISTQEFRLNDSQIGAIGNFGSILARSNPHVLEDVAEFIRSQMGDYIEGGPRN